jgi:hypothetical protein
MTLTRKIIIREIQDKIRIELNEMSLDELLIIAEAKPSIKVNLTKPEEIEAASINALYRKFKGK